MKKNILMLINGFGVEKQGSYSVYSKELMPNFDKLTTERIFKTIPNAYMDYKEAYRNFSMDINNALTYNLIDNEIFKVSYPNNQLLQYIIQEINKNEKCKLHVFCYWDSDKTAEQLTTYIKEIQQKTNNKIYVHLILCQSSLASYQYIERNFTTLNYDLGANVKIGLITGLNTFSDNLALKEYMKSYITEYGEKYKDISKKIELQMQTKSTPSMMRTFAVSYGYGITEGDKVLFFNYSNFDVTNMINELKIQKYRPFNESTIQYFSLFPVKNEVQIPFMYNYAVASSYMLNSLKEINAKCLVYDLKEKCPIINYYLTGLKNDIDELLKYTPTDDGILFDKDRLMQSIKEKSDKDLYILNYDITSVKTIEELENVLKQIDVIIGELHNYVLENNYALIISSFYGMVKDMYNVKKELHTIDFSGKTPIVFDDSSIISTNYTVKEGSLYDLCNTLLKNINPEYKEEGLIKKKSSLFSFLYKKPKKIEGDKK